MRHPPCILEAMTGPRPSQRSNTMDPAEIDVLSNLAYRDGPPHDQLDWLRRNRPLHHQTINDPIMVGESWVVTRHSDLMEVSRSLEHVGNFEGHNLRNDHDTAGVRHLLMMDRPEHTEKRLMVSRSFTPRVVRRYTEHYHDMAGRILESILGTAGGRSVDIVEHLSVEFPMMAIVELMGTSIDDRDRLLHWSNATISNLDPDYSPSSESRASALADMTAYALDLADKRREHPADDLATELVRRVDVGELTEAEYASYVILVFVAGNETTRNNISWGIKAFSENPEQWDLLRADPERYLDPAVEEVTRWASPVNYMSRTVHTPFELHGQTLKAGEKIALMYLSANRDADVFTEPYRFDITRDPNPQIAFGYGAHFCMGAHLARLETRAVLSELSQRVTRIQPAGEVEYVWSSFINGIKRLPVRLVPS